MTTTPDKRKQKADLEIHKLIAEALDKHPEVVDHAQHLLRLSTVSPELVGRWQELLALDANELAQAITVETPEAAVLRAVSPLPEAAQLRGLGFSRRPVNQISLRRTSVDSKLAGLRLVAGLTQEEMAERTTIPLSTYWRLERKRLPNPPVGYLAACARVLGVPIDELIEDEWLEWQNPQKPSK